MECSNVKYAQPIVVIDRVRFKPEHCKLRPETGRGEDVCGVKFHPNWSVRGVNFNPNRRIKFSQKLPKKMAKYGNFTNITQREWFKTKKMIPNRNMFDIWISNQRVYLGWKRGSSGRHIPTDSDRRSASPGWKSYPSIHWPIMRLWCAHVCDFSSRVKVWRIV